MPRVSVPMQTHVLSEFSVYLQQRPGELAGVLEAAKVAGVSITSVSTTEYQDKGCVRLLGEPVASLRQVCESLVDAGIGPVVEAPVVAVGVRNKPGTIRDLSLLMADNGINIRYCYMVPELDGVEGSACVLRFDEHERALEVIAATDWPVVETGEDDVDSGPGESAA